MIREDGFRKLLTAFNTQRCLNPAISLGLAEGAFDEAVNYVRERTVFGKPIADHQGIRWKLADMFKDIEAGAGHSVSRLPDRQSVPRSVHGGGGEGVLQRDVAARHRRRRCSFTAASASPTKAPVSRLYRGARYGTIGGGTSETLRDLMGRKIVGDVDFDQGILGLGTY